jgi:hypothetical protein
LRRKRVNGKANASFAANVDLPKISGPAASQLVRTLSFMKGIDSGRITFASAMHYPSFLKEKSNLLFLVKKVKKYKGTILCIIYYSCLAEQ